MKLFFTIFLLLIFSLFTSCKQNIESSNTLIGKELYFPSNLIFTRLATDTIPINYTNSIMKVIIYSDTSGCMGCKLQLNKWKEFAESINSQVQDSVLFLFYLHPKDINEIQYIINSENFTHPICFDFEDRLKTLNNFSTEEVFLLDKNNKILITGNPITNLDIKNLYLKTFFLNEKNNTIKTEAIIEKEFINIGNPPPKNNRKKYKYSKYR